MMILAHLEWLEIPLSLLGSALFIGAMLWGVSKIDG